MILLPRQYYCPDGYYERNGRCYDDDGYSNWDSYGRWIVLAAIIAGAFFIFFAFACITARRRRRQGMNPYRGTGWAAGRTPAGHAPAQYTGAPQPHYQQSNNAAPAYAPPNQGYYGHDSNQGYFGGGQQNGVELQPSFPSNTYQPQRGGDNVYNPPPGPPPGKQNDGIVR